METTTKEEWLAELARLFPAEIVGFKRPEDGVPTDLEFGTYLPPLIAKDGVKCDQINAYLRQLLSSDKDLKANTEAIKNQLANCDLRVVTETLKGLMGPDMLKKLNGIQAGALNNPHPATHPATIISQDATHRFATDAEKNTWNGKANASHCYHVPTTQTANNAVFLRNDNTWQAVTPGNVGAYTKGEIDGKVNTINTAINGKANASHGNHVPATQAANNTIFLRNDNSWASVTPGNLGAYTKAEIDGKVNTINTAINGKAAASHGNHVPTTQGANNAVFLRNDNTWATVTAGNIGAAVASHTHNYAGSGSAGGAANASVKLNTARTLTVGNTGKIFDGTANLAWTLAEIGAAAASHGTHVPGGGSSSTFLRGDMTWQAMSSLGGITAYSLAQNGYVKFACGLILQWGWGAADGSGIDTVSNISFPVAFAQCFGVSISTQQSGYTDGSYGGADVWYQVISWTTTTVKVVRQQANSPLREPTKPFIIAIGK